MVGAIQNNPNLGNFTSATKSVGGDQELFQQMLTQAMEIKNNSALKPEEKLSTISQIATKAIEEIKRKHPHILDEDPEEGSTTQTTAPIAPSTRSFLKGIAEENGPLKSTKNDTLKAIPSELLSKIDPDKRFLAQLPQANQAQRPIANNALARRRPGALIAQTPTGKISVTPFQIFLDKAMDFFEMVSDMENPSDSMTQDFVNGKISMEELALIKAKVGIAVSFAMTVVNQVTQTFKEIQNMQV